MATTPDTVHTVAVLGVGTMGQGIAVACALAGHRVQVNDRQEVIAAALDAVADRYARAGGQGEVAELVWRSVSIPDAVAGADLVIEAVPERPGLKRAVFRELSGTLGEHAVLATNTSSLPLTDLVTAVEAKDRFLATHFFNPAELVPGVEVAGTEHTARSAIDRATAFLTGIGKEPVVVGAGAGFVANRIQLALFLEALACVRDGTATPEEVDAVVRRTFGFRLPAYGPFAIADMAGLDVYASILAALEAAHGSRFAIPDELADLVERGRIGTKVRSGFRDYTEEEVAQLLASRDAKYRRLLDAAESG